MLSLSPAKLLVILVIALIVLGPEKLPQVARQIGAAWHDLRQWRSRIESEVRGTFPNLPPTNEVAQAVRSPLAFLDKLADDHERAVSEQQTASPEPTSGAGTEVPGPGPPAAGPGPAGNGTAPHNGSAVHNGAGVHSDSGVPNGAAPRAGERSAAAFPVVPDDPSMN
jgi:sec-independent protein translocase protein TatB